MSAGVWAAFEADNAVAFEEALTKCPNPNAILINSANPLVCQAIHTVGLNAEHFLYTCTYIYAYIPTCAYIVCMNEIHTHPGP